MDLLDNDNRSSQGMNLVVLLLLTSVLQLWNLFGGVPSFALSFSTSVKVRCRSKLRLVTFSSRTKILSRSSREKENRRLWKDRNAVIPLSLKADNQSHENGAIDGDDGDGEDSRLVVASSEMSHTDAVRRLLGQDESVATSPIGTTDPQQQQQQYRRDLLINAAVTGVLIASGVAMAQLFTTSVYTPSRFQRFSSTQFIAALGDPTATEGTIDVSTAPWGVWRVDPGPRGVWLRDYRNNQNVGTVDTNTRVAANDDDQPSASTTTVPTSSYSYVTPAGWTLDPQDWWLEEHGLIMESPQFPLPSGRYLVTGGRSVTTGLTVDAVKGRWKLDEGATLYDVTHLPCRAARYRPVTTGASPAGANPRDFPVAPGATMPPVKGCSKQDYAVLFLVGKATL